MNKSCKNTIAVTGGKGGTGKSTFAIILAFSQIEKGQKVLLVDCDVECPNDYLLLGLDNLDGVVKDTITYYPKFNEEKCTKCGLCVNKCKFGALYQPKENVPILEQDLCSSCGVCWTICPNGAITKKSVKNGVVFFNRLSESLSLVTGRSLPGVRDTSSVVDQTREYVEEICEDYDIVIIDSAAGSHCTVMKAIEGVSRAYAVTEPTPVGAHDLKIILEVLKVLSVKSEIVLNKSDLGDKQLIEKIAKDYESSISVHIPYDETLAKMYSDGQILENLSYLSNLISKTQ